MEYAKVNVKGLLEMKFSEFTYVNDTEGLRSLQGTEEIGLFLDLSIDESKNGLDDDVVKFDYEVTEFNQ